SAVDLHPIRAPIAQKADRATRDEHLRTESLRLGERARRQLLSADPGREAQVVLDAGAGARLATRRPGLDHEHLQPFGLPVAGPAPTTTRSCSSCGSRVSLNPSAAATSWLDGLRSTVSQRAITTGTSEVASPNSSSNSCTPSSRSRSR